MSIQILILIILIRSGRTSSPITMIFPTEDQSTCSHHPLESSIEYYSQGLALLAAVKRTNPSGAKESLIEFAWLRRCVADKNLYYNRVETYWQDDNVI